MTRPSLISPTALHQFEEYLRAGKYEKAAKVLEKNTPGRLSRMFSRSGTIEEKERQLAALLEYSQHHRQWREQHKAIEKYAKLAEEDSAAALYKILKSPEWKKLAAEGPNGALFQKLKASDNPAAKVLLGLANADLRRSWYGTATPALQEIKATLSRLPEAVDLRDISTLFRELEQTSRREMEEARKLREEAGQDKKDATILARELDRAIKQDFRGILGNRRVDLRQALNELLQNPNGFDDKAREALLSAARKTAGGWKDEIYQHAKHSSVPHGIVADTARTLTTAFNAAADWTGDAYRLGKRVAGGIWDRIPAHIPKNDEPSQAFNLA